MTIVLTFVKIYVIKEPEQSGLFFICFVESIKKRLKKLNDMSIFKTLAAEQETNSSFKDRNAHFCVYAHVRLDTGKVFYVGKGSVSRAYSTRNRNKYWNNVVNKTTYKVQILQQDLVEQEAFSVEIYYIALFRLLHQPLTNLTAGGEGTSGHKQSKETIEKKVLKLRGKKRTLLQKLRLKEALNRPEVRRKKAISLSGSRNGMYGKKHSEEFKQNLTKRMLGNNYMLGHKHTADSKAKMSSARTGEKNYLFDRKIYTFIHESGQRFTGTRSQLADTYGFDRKSLRPLFLSNPKVKALGWSLLKNTEKNNGY